MVNITVAREKQTFLFDTPIEVMVDGSKVGEVKSAEALTNVQVTEGQHCISFKAVLQYAEVSGIFTTDSVINVRFNKMTGEIEAALNGAVQVETTHDWQSKPRDPKTVYPDQRKTSPAVAAILSFLVVGLGQMLNGQLIKGLLMLLGAFVIGAITGGIGAVIIWIISAVDGYMSCNKLKQGTPIGRFSFF
ncbi:MAG: hypothetical protein LUG86_09225 [Oscillospiraceae bacterium]|nr:hypothetical protein [Oscillospiraceae bacterium]